MAAAARGGAICNLFAPYAKQMGFVITPDTRKDAIDVVAANYDQLSDLERREFETTALQLSFGRIQTSRRPNGVCSRAYSAQLVLASSQARRPEPR